VRTSVSRKRRRLVAGPPGSNARCDVDRYERTFGTGPDRPDGKIVEDAAVDQDAAVARQRRHDARHADAGADGVDQRAAAVDHELPAD
jgi:hypothetical protein